MDKDTLIWHVEKLSEQLKKEQQAQEEAIRRQQAAQKAASSRVRRGR
jgi:hypothetical protein